MKTQSKSRSASIYRNQSVSLRAIFDEAKSLRHVLSRRARVARDPMESEPAIYREMRELCRSRQGMNRRHR